MSYRKRRSKAIATSSHLVRAAICVTFDYSSQECVGHQARVVLVDAQNRVVPPEDTSTSLKEARREG
jgi:aspartate 1-decarboxylase